MAIPNIYYGTIKQHLHTNAQYILMKAGITNGSYETKDFLEKIHSVSLDSITENECKRDIENQKVLLEIFCANGTTVTIEDFKPDPKYLIQFVNTTFAELHALLVKRANERREK